MLIESLLNKPDSFTTVARAVVLNWVLLEYSGERVVAKAIVFDYENRSIKVDYFGQNVFICQFSLFIKVGPGGLVLRTVYSVPCQEQAILEVLILRCDSLQIVVAQFLLIIL